MSEARHLVLGTAGHIDHGKSALVHALTGVHPDRLAEEQRRGITIELGFADMTLEGVGVVSFVDVPGHERFVRRMVAGATGIDAVLLVVAADQAVQPQTREHLDICRLLEIPRGVVALSKCDLVDEELCGVAELEVRELVADSFLADATIVPVSAKTGEGLDRLREEIGRLFEQLPPRRDAGVARLPVDRSFVQRGFGSVVTGTLASGSLEEGDEVIVEPGGKRGRIRGLQVHRDAVARSVAGQRTAVNIQGVETVDVPRGSTIGRPGTLLTTRRVWARMQLLPGAPDGLKRGGPVRFHQGTSEGAARVRVLDREAGSPYPVEIVLKQPTVLVPGDHFILRRPAPVDTVGGGVIVDAHPPHAREARPHAFDGAALEPVGAVVLRLQRAGGAGRLPDELAPELGLSRDELGALGRQLATGGQIVEAAGRWILGDAWRAIAARAEELVDRFHRDEPLRMGITREELRAQTAPEMPQEMWRPLVEALAADGRLRLDGERIARPDHEVVLDRGARELAVRIELAFRDAGLDPPELEQLIQPSERKGADEIVALLIAERKLTRLQDGRLFHSEALDELRRRLREHARSSPRIDVGAFKQLAGVTRKNAIPLLEHLDAEKATRRVGNEREILLEP